MIRIRILYHILANLDTRILKIYPLHIYLLSNKSYTIFSMKNPVRVLLWQQSRIKMAENLHLIQFISQTSSVTPNLFCIKTFLYL